jgi:hypothetical protein
MPLLDHFHPPIFPRNQWESFHSNWATRIADALTEQLSEDYRVEEHIHAGPGVEIDVATYGEFESIERHGSNGAGRAATAARAWAPPTAAVTVPAFFPDAYEVRVFGLRDGLVLVAAIEIVSPGNKDRPEARLAFATKCASYLQRGVALIVVDIVTNCRSNLHNATMRLIEAPAEADLSVGADLYAVACRPVLRKQKPEIDLWPATFALGDSLPTLPLRLTGDLFVPVDFQATYHEACRRRRLA